MSRSTAVIRVSEREVLSRIRTSAVTKPMATAKLDAHVEYAAQAVRATSAVVRTRSGWSPLTKTAANVAPSRVPTIRPTPLPNSVL